MHTSPAKVPSREDSEPPQGLPLNFRPQEALLEGVNRRNIAKTPHPEFLVRWLPRNNGQGQPLPDDAPGLVECLKDTSVQLQALEREGIEVVDHQFFIGGEPNQEHATVPYAVVRQLDGHILDPHIDEHKKHLGPLANKIAHYIGTTVANGDKILWDAARLSQYMLTADGKVVLIDIDPFISPTRDKEGDLLPIAARAYDLLDAWGAQYLTEENKQLLEPCKKLRDEELAAILGRSRTVPLDIIE